MPYDDASTSWLGSLHLADHAGYGADLTGIDWSSIIPDEDATPAQTMAEIWNLCARATSRTDGYCNQTLRATVDIELQHGPDYRVTSGPAAGGAYPTPYWGNTRALNARLIMSRWPVLSVTSVQVCPNNQWPRQWTALPTGYAEPEVPPLGVYGSISPGGSAEGGQAIIVGGGYINWCYGRNGWAIKTTYINGWPHCSLTSAVDAGVTSLPVNDCTGWAIENYYDTYTGATGAIEDSGQQEAIHVTASSVTAGPGTLTLSQATNYPHAAGTIVTTMPQSIQQACILFCTAEALTRGATSTTIHSVGGRAVHTGGDIEGLNAEAELMLYPYRRTILRCVAWRWRRVSCGTTTTKRQAHVAKKAAGPATKRAVAKVTRKASTSAVKKKATATANKKATSAANKKAQKSPASVKAHNTASKTAHATASKTASATARATASAHAKATASAHAKATASAHAKATAKANASKRAAIAASKHTTASKVACQVKVRKAVRRVVKA